MEGSEGDGDDSSCVLAWFMLPWTGEAVLELAGYNVDKGICKGSGLE